MDLSALGVFSASGDITSALEDIIMSLGVSLGDVQCIGRYHKLCMWGYHECIGNYSVHFWGES